MQLLLEQMNGYVLVAVLVLCILVLSKATDILVDEAISLSLEWDVRTGHRRNNCFFGNLPTGISGVDFFVLEGQRDSFFG